MYIIIAENGEAVVILSLRGAGIGRLTSDDAGGILQKKEEDKMNHGKKISRKGVKKMKKLLVVMLAVMFVASCGSSQKSVSFKVDTKTPTTVNSADDLPKPTLSPQDISDRGAIVVIGESAAGQSQYDALTAARGVAQKNLLSVVNGVRVNADGLITKGVLSEDNVKVIVNGHIKAIDCGAYYDRGSQVGYYCVQLPLK